MKYILVLVALIALVTPPCPAETYGQQLTLQTTTPIANILDDPEAWQGKRVQVAGTVTDVCPMKGCWMSLREGEAALRIKVEDDVIVFPEAAKEQQAKAEGIVEVVEMDREGYTSWKKHLADERGEPFDPTTVGEGPYRLVQIRGEGAEIDL